MNVYVDTRYFCACGRACERNANMVAKDLVGPAIGAMLLSGLALPQRARTASNTRIGGGAGA